MRRKKKPCTCFTQERLLTGGCGGCWSVQLLFGDERCTLKMHTMYVCCVRGGDGRDVSLCLHLPHLLLALPPQRRLNKSGENTQGEKKKSNFFFSFHQQFMMERCSTYSPHRPPSSTLREVAPQHRGFAPPLPSEPMQIKAQIPIDLGAGNRRYDRKPPRHLLLRRPHRPQPKLHVYD